MAYFASCTVCDCSATSCQTCKAPSDCSNCVSCCCAESHKAWRLFRIHRGLLVEFASSAWMTIEVGGALLAGILSGSLALFAFGGDSIIELVSGLVVIRHLRADLEGSVLLGRRTAQLASVLLFALIPTIGLAGVYSYVSGLRPDASPLGIAIATGAIVVMPILLVLKRRIGRETRCLPLSIDAYESAACFLMSIVLLGGLTLVYFTGIFWIDYVATAVILSFVTKEAIESFRESTSADGPRAQQISSY